MRPGGTKPSRSSSQVTAAIFQPAAVLLLIAFICGIYAEIWAGRPGVPQDPIEWHEFVANIASWGFVVLMAWRMFLSENTRKSLIIYVIIGLAWYSLLVITTAGDHITSIVGFTTNVMTRFGLPRTLPESD